MFQNSCSIHHSDMRPSLADSFLVPEPWQKLNSLKPQDSIRTGMQAYPTLNHTPTDLTGLNIRMSHMMCILHYLSTVAEAKYEDVCSTVF